MTTQNGRKVTFFFFSSLPNKSMIKKSEEARGGKIPKERLTISYCVSTAGEKEKALVTWKCQRHRCFKRKNLNHLGVSWYANKKAWMTSFIFEECLIKFDKKRGGNSNQESSPSVGQCDVSCERSSAHKCQTVISSSKYNIKTSVIG